MQLYPPLYQTSQGTPRDLGSLLSMESQGFGDNVAYYQQHFGTNGHAGIDWPCATSTPIYASHDGTVESVSLDSTRGEGVVLRGSDGVTLYWHMLQPLVNVGDLITRGQKIGLSDNTGLSTGSHLHFEYRPDTEPKNNGFYGAVDPTPFLVWGVLPQNNEIMTKEAVNLLYAILQIEDKDGSGHTYWVGKPVEAFLKIFAKDRSNQLLELSK